MRWELRSSLGCALVVLAGARPAAAQVAAPVAAPASSPSLAVPAEPTGWRNHLFPLAENATFLLLLNAIDRVIFPTRREDGKLNYAVTPTTAWDHLRKQRWVLDNDPFNVNQFGHPYQGSIMYGLARSSGHGFWASMAHANVGSFIWEIAGETTQPSFNDLITTGQAGSLLGEALYRMADLVLKDDQPAIPHRKHELGAALLSPAGGLNRRIFGKRFKARLPDTAPATAWQVSFGATTDALAKDFSSPVNLLRRDATIEFALAYGLPGQAGYKYERPLDYFDFQFAFLSSAKNPIENVMIRGLLIGKPTAAHAGSSGVWGLYGSYDYISPYLFRVSSTALSVGTTRQYWIGPFLDLQGTVLGGVGYGAAGSPGVLPPSDTTPEVRDYHAGATPQALLALRLIAGDRAMFDLTAREFYVRGTGADAVEGSETIFRGTLGLSVRLRGNSAISARVVSSTRDGRYGVQANRKISEKTVTVAYSILGGSKFGAIGRP